MLFDSWHMHESPGLGKSSNGLSSISLRKTVSMAFAVFFFFKRLFFSFANYSKDNWILQITQRQLHTDNSGSPRGVKQMDLEVFSREALTFLTSL